VPRDRATIIAEHLAPYLQPEHQVLEIGAGNGLVAQALQRMTGAHLRLVDVVDYNQSSLPCMTYDGAHLPFPERSFDYALLVFVLHHAPDPLPVVREALRVSKKGLLICENHVAGRWRKPLTRIVDSLPHFRYGVPVCYRTLSSDEWQTLLAPLVLDQEPLGRFTMGGGFWQNFVLRLTPRG
jgi:ubiquinone/menaquinone biosynthesis C-methylase UbiE